MIRCIICTAYCVMISLVTQAATLKIVDETTRSNGKTDGFFTVCGGTTVKIPFGNEFLGYENLTYGNDEAVFYLQNYRQGKLSGKEICWSNSSLIYIAHYDDGVLDGMVTIFPEGVYTCNFTVRKGILSGKSEAFFTPFKYANGNFKISDDFSPEYASRAITEGSAAYTLSAIGEYRDGKKYNGEFLEIKQMGSYTLVSVSRYKEGALLNQSPESVYQIPPRLHKW